jgi:tetratricopeptide (TPR) repeat protein
MPDPSNNQPSSSHTQNIDGQAHVGVAVSGNVQGSIYNTQHIHSVPQSTIDPVEAARLLAELPLDRIPDPAPLPPGSRMPLSPNPLFVGREQDLKDIATALKAGTTSVIAAATGMGGVGKTQLASEFVHRYGHYFIGGVFWLSFAEANGVEVEIAACGTAMDLPNFAALKFPDQVARVRQLWQEATPRLLIFDNCEDEQLLRDYRPTAGGCRVLVTSRRQHWDVALGIFQQRLDTLPRAQSIDLLRKFRPDLPEGDPDLDALAHTLGDLPLALHVAGSYLKRYQTSVSPAQYLEKLHSAPLQAFALRAASPTPTQHERDLALTLAASYQRLDPNDPTDALALAILARAAHFAPGEPIPHDLLQATLDLSDLPEDEQYLAFDDALIRLIELGLCDPIENRALRLHRLIDAFILSVTTDETAQSAIEVVLIEEGNKRVESGYPTQLQPILAHLRHAQQQADPRGDHRAGDLASILGRAEQMLVNYAQAESLLKRALAISKQTLGENHADTAANLNNLAFLHEMQDDYTSAKQLYEKTVANLERNFGPNHANTAASLTSLANLHLQQGNYHVAKSLLERTLAIFKKVYDPNHPNIATNLNILAGVLKSEGNYKAAERLFKQSLTIREKVLGPKHPDTATSLNNLANSYKDSRKYAAAKPLYKRAIAIREEVLGPNHPETASSLNNLAVLYRELHDYDAAKPLFERALSIYEQVLGPNHTKTAYALNNLAAMHQEQGDYQTAQLLFERTLTIYTQTLGPNHPNTAIVLNNIAKLLKNQGNYQAAKPLYERSITIYEQAFGPDHPHIQLFRSNLQELLKILGQ